MKQVMDNPHVIGEPSRVKQLENELLLRGEEIANIKRSVKYTRIQELEQQLALALQNQVPTEPKVSLKTQRKELKRLVTECERLNSELLASKQELKAMRDSLNEKDQNIYKQ